jgi:hypothetical protein
VSTEAGIDQGGLMLHGNSAREAALSNLAQGGYLGVAEAIEFRHNFFQGRPSAVVIRRHVIPPMLPPELPSGSLAHSNMARDQQESLSVKNGTGPA